MISIGLEELEPVLLVILNHWSVLLFLVFCLYLLLCSSLRFQRCRGMHQSFNYPTQESFSSMSVDDAWAIQSYLFELEFPRIFSGSVFFAIFKTYGIPSGSALLASTGQLGTHANAPKRAADTGILLVEAVVNPPNSPRSLAAISRINYMHNIYRKQKKISDDDMLYALSLFALEPMRWVNRLEWRKLTEMERCAVGTYWRCMGTALGVPYDLLPNCGKWTDGLHWLDEIDHWSQSYEEQFMLPAPSNKKLAERTVDILVELVPISLRGTATQIIMVLVGDRLREAIMYDKPPRFYFNLVSIVFTIRRILLRYLCLPRFECDRVSHIPTKPDLSTGRYNAVKWVVYPWYAKPTFSNRWHPVSWALWLVGAVLPGDKGSEKYLPEGYSFAELGPKSIKGKGDEAMEEDRKDLFRRRVMGGCPFLGKE